ncbi:GIY-YIG nuclease family protein [Cohnella sp. AR92]|uniref:GIY-YIG nuclease family protein n=1 Tax=Cohnella sp. AR92 TaxID=648716 RepID=UPI00192E0371|nr:GIY-YIG nuclease family protein [Cohnella sp. AR92]
MTEVNESFFPQRPESKPMIYAYEDSNPLYKGLLKVGYTAVDVERRVAQQYPTVRPGAKPYRIVFKESAMHSDGSSFTDRDVHRFLRKRGFRNPDGEWFQCTVEDLRAAYLAVKRRSANEENRTRSFGLRPEQEEAIRKTMAYFESARADSPDRAPKFLWNAKMRFGKTFASYQLAKRMGMARVLILTFKPAVESAWSEDLLSHADFEGWQFIGRGGITHEEADPGKPMVCFGSFQDFLGVNRETGGIKAKNEWVHSTDWELVIFDEYHFGAWRENAKKLFESEDEDEYDTLDIEKYKKDEEPNAYNETFLPIKTAHYLFLSGTPFRAMNSGEFIEEQIYNWTYSDEQRAKENWTGPDNPYESLPRMVMMTYKIPDSIREIAVQGEFNEFDLNVFFSAKGKGDEARFLYENEVQKWLDLIRGSYLETTVDELKLGAKKPAMPFSDTRLLNILSHTLWFLPNVASCFAMRNLLLQKQNTFYHDYRINVCAGAGAGIGLDALKPVLDSMDDPLESKTITLSCGKLTTGVTVKPWTGIFMLRNLSSPESYFQAAFRVQSPWEVETEAGKREIMKRECYVFDFALDRALKQIADYSCRLNVNESNPEAKVEEFISFLPVLAYDGSAMTSISAGDVLDIALAGTSATLLARRWESALLVNVNNETLLRLMANEDAMDALMKIEGFRSLNADIETIINKSDAVKKAKKENKDELTPKEKQQLTQDEKDMKSKRKQIQEKLIKFAARVPVFMYLTDYRERSLKDVITQLEPGLFKTVTGLDVKDFDLLVSLGVFNESVMNDAIFKFKRYEDSSLNYTGIDKHEGEDIGLFNTVISNYDYMHTLQQSSMAAPSGRPSPVSPPRAATSAAPAARQSRPASGAETAKLAKPPVAASVPSPKAAAPTASPAVRATEAATETAAAAEVDCSGVQVGSRLVHKAFGEGKVIAIDGDLMTVAFGGSVKKFAFPDSIQRGFFTLE